MRIVLVILLFYSGFISCNKKITPTQYSYSTISIDSTAVIDSSILKMNSAYKVYLDSIMQKTICFNCTTLTKKPLESSLGNWVCDALINFCRDSLKLTADFAIVNYGGIRINQLDSGQITLGQLFELMPFDNTLVIVEVDSIKIMQLLSHIAPMKGWPQSAGLRYTIVHDSIPTDITIHGLPLNNHTTYQLVVSDYLYNGGDNVDFLKLQKSTVLPYLLRDALISSCRKNNSSNNCIRSKIDGRLVRK